MSAFGVGRYDFRGSLRGTGLTDYRFDSEQRPIRITAGRSDHNGDVWVVDNPAAFLSLMAADTSGVAVLGARQLEPSAGSVRWRLRLGCRYADGEVEAVLSTAGYSSHVQPFVHACS